MIFGRLTAWALATTMIMLFCSGAFAWNGFGHMEIATLAYERLTPETRARVDSLLTLNPDYGTWPQGVPDNQRGEIAFLRAALWPDAIKLDAAYIDDGQIPTAPYAARNIGYQDRLRHRYWHYIDVPFSPDGTPLIRPPNVNAESEIALMRTALGSPEESNNVKSYDLTWLIHLVGDVHQPLHATSRFTHDLPKGDRGGNEVIVCVELCGSLSLHAYWDDVLGESDIPQSAIEAAHKLLAPDPALAAISDEDEWIAESDDVAKRVAYDSPVGLSAGPYELDVVYEVYARSAAKQRVALAGFRLANLLNDTLGANP